MQDFGQRPQNLPQLAPAAHMVPPLVMSSSNVSTSTLDSELISPNTTQETKYQAVVSERPVKTTFRDSTSPSGTATSDDSILAKDTRSMNVGTKRTASGTIKPASPTRDTKVVQQQSAASSKRHSAIELSADLRTRLKYAMLKVQNGWETHNIEQLEQLPIASPKRATTDSPTADWSRRESISSSDAYFMSPMANVRASPISNIRASHDSSRVLQRQLHDSPALPPYLTQHPLHGQATLAPPAQITSQRRPGKRSFNAHYGGPIGRNRSSSSVSQGITNQAEQDAVASLMFMSSPGTQTSGRLGVFASPSRNKRVEFDMSGAQRR